MKAIIEFNLPEEQSDFACAGKARSLSSIIWELDQWLRSECKYQDKPYDEVRDKLRELMSDEGLTFDSEMFN